jgi:hypothetical protein
LTLHKRPFSGGETYESNLLSELTHARSRRLDLAWDKPAQLTFTMDGHNEAAALIAELQHEVIAWRWDDTAGQDVPMFRGIVGQSEDQLTEQNHVVTFTCHDYAAVLGRRFNVADYTATQIDQDDIAASLLALGSSGAVASDGTSFMPGSYLPLTLQMVDPDGTPRGLSGVLRDRTYPAQTDLLDALTNLANVQGGFDFDVLPTGAPDHETDALRIFYPRQGVTRSTPVLAYGGLVATVTRALTSNDYANHARVIGNNGSADPAVPQMFSEAADMAAASGVTVGLWSYPDNAADVSIQSTLDAKAAGDLAYYGVLVPSYTLGLAPGAYHAGMFNMGDTLPLVILSGRLRVNTDVRVVALAFSVGDDGDEDVEVTVGRPVETLLGLLSATAADVNALARR